MKILLVHVSFSETFQSGVNPIVFETYESLKKQGHDVYIFATDIKPYYDESYKYSKYFIKSTPFLSKNKNKFTQLKLLINSTYNFNAKINLEKMLDEIKPELVHIHTTLDISFSILKPIKKRNIPIIYTFHDLSLLCPSSLFSIKLNKCNDCSGYNILPCIFKKCINKSFIKSLIISFKAFMERFLGAFKDIDLYIAVSEAEKNHLLSCNIKDSKIKVLPNFINTNLINENIENYSQDTKYFLYAGGTNKIKGIYTLLNAIKLLPQEIEFHIAGCGDYSHINKFIKDNKLNNIKILGQLNKTQLQKEYKHCISVIMPSEWFEVFGMINIEAAIYGNPSISSNMGALPKIIENNKTGLIFEAENVDQLKECILKYWYNKDLANRHGQNAKDKILNNYNEKVYFDRLNKIYKEVCKG